MKKIIFTFLFFLTSYCLSNKYFSLQDNNFQDIDNVIIKNFSVIYVQPWPLIVQYFPDNSFPETNFAAFKLDELTLIKNLPDKILTQISTKLGISSSRDSFLSDLKSKNIILLSYANFISQIHAKQRTYNLNFHPVCLYIKSTFLKVDQDSLIKTNFKINQNVGLFTFPVNGIEQVSKNGIPFDTLNLEEIYYHDFKFSPDNCQFNIKSGLTIIPFFTVAILDDAIFVGKKYLNIVLNIFIKSVDFPYLDAAFSPIINQTFKSDSRLLEILDGIEKLGALDGLGKQAIKDVRIFFTKSLKPVTPVEPIKPPVSPVKPIAPVETEKPVKTEETDDSNQKIEKIIKECFAKK